MLTLELKIGSLHLTIVRKKEFELQIYITQKSELLNINLQLRKKSEWLRQGNY